MKENHMSNTNNHKPLTQNLGAALMAAGVTNAGGHIPAHMGIDIVTPKADPMEGFNAEGEESYSIEGIPVSGSRDAVEGFAMKARRHRQVIDLRGRTNAQKDPVSGHKNNEANHTASQNNVTKEIQNIMENNSAQVNGSVSNNVAPVQPVAQAPEFSPELAALRGIAGLEALVKVAEKFSKDGIKHVVAQQEAKPVLRDKSAAILVGAGIGGIAGAVGGVVAATYLSSDVPATTEEKIGAAGLLASVGMLGGAGIGLTWSNWGDRRDAKKAAEKIAAPVVEKK